jgi:hypothetical protein
MKTNKEIFNDIEKELKTSFEMAKNEGRLAQAKEGFRVINLRINKLIFQVAHTRDENAKNQFYARINELKLIKKDLEEQIQELEK